LNEGENLDTFLGQEVCGGKRWDGKKPVPPSIKQALEKLSLIWGSCVIARGLVDCMIKTPVARSLTCDLGRYQQEQGDKGLSKRAGEGALMATSIQRMEIRIKAWNMAEKSLARYLPKKVFIVERK